MHLFPGTLMMNEVKAYLSKVAAITDSRMNDLLPPPETYPASIHSVMRYSLFAGGKRIRPALVMASYEACGGNFGDDKPVIAGAAIEMLHTFSLMHDDLPCMDDDDFRRGKTTAHKAFTEALAVLGGDALCIYAFECLTKLDRIEVIREIARALGTGGMIGGQVIDIESEGKKVDKKAVEYIHNNKTAALIRTSVKTGALLADAPQSHLEHLTAYGNRIGLAFQVIDDILDEEGTTVQIGKDAGSDRQRGKATFPSVCGIAESREYAKTLIENACAELRFLNNSGPMLTAIARFIETRIS
ncbi:MAG: polyprenyl synthetase family protein [Chitinivibrionales bacterium]|nr:polyprenyl synthetase family protein [Chitinivibrionales bacterium]